MRKEEMHERVHEARVWAIEAHGDQKHGDRPYASHLDDVAGVLVEFGFGTPDFLQAAYLHDILEDTPVTYEEVVRRHGRRVAELVFAVTSEEGHPNRKARNAATYANRTIHVPGGVTLKCADRLANIRCGGREVEMYRKEHPSFTAALRGKGEAEEIWRAIDEILGRNTP